MTALLCGSSQTHLGTPMTSGGGHIIRAGLIGAAAIMLLALGPRQDWAAMIGSVAFQAKLVYAAALVLAGLEAVRRLARPSGRAVRASRVLPIIFGLACVVAIVCLMRAAPEDRRGLLLGNTALVCPFLIGLVAAPVLASLLAVLRRLAPTRPIRAGAAAGLLAGAAAAFVYAFHCPESGLPFVALWYTAGILLSSAIGAAMGPQVLRW
ncbi:NrsF family protein [Paracoccus litorisediminis]|uniref:DUF1109 family protein n=1 Tax=Paracoccus litorisediminis TaxID=2006130 RepID=A0A844HRU7_9RHOB|nr:DUF1109 family protein [Paracoccus litorisediminis]